MVRYSRTVYERTSAFVVSHVSVRGRPPYRRHSTPPSSASAAWCHVFLQLTSSPQGSRRMYAFGEHRRKIMKDCPTRKAYPKGLFTNSMFSDWGRGIKRGEPEGQELGDQRPTTAVDRVEQPGVQRQVWSATLILVTRGRKLTGHHYL